MRDQLNKTAEFAEIEDGNVREALKDFRASVHAWSDAAYGASRPVAAHAGIAWRRMVAWALSLVLSAGAVSGALYERHHEKELAQQRHQRELRQEQQEKLMAAQQHAQESEDLLDGIDSDVARQVPSAMEPLAQMMTDDSGMR